MEIDNSLDESPENVDLSDDDDEDEKGVVESTKRGVKRKAISNGDDIITINSDESSSASEDTPAIYVEESESEPEIDCERWDSDCKVVKIPISNRIEGIHYLPQIPKFNTKLTDCNFIKTLQKCWSEDKALNDSNVEIINDPFKVCVVKDFLGDDKLLNGLRNEFNEIDWNKRNLDLYEFFQSKDLKYVNFAHANIRSVYDFLKSDVRNWVSDITGLELTTTSATCSFYSYTDYLLVHDDLQDDRMVAFVLYFTDGSAWNCKHGGALQLFSTNDDGEPGEVVRNIYPSHNQFVFFPVSNKSYHQVAEVLNKNDCRFSINGWFHTPKPVVFKRNKLSSPVDGLYGKNTQRKKQVDIDLGMWINSIYLELGVIQRIHMHIEVDSEISLKTYFKAEPLREVLDSLQSEEVKWKKVGPPNRRLYEVIEEENLPHTLGRFLDLFQSSQMFYLLQKYTGLELSNDKASMRYELQRWKPGSYSLISDYNWHSENELDVILYLGCSKPSMIVGGRTQYISAEEEVHDSPVTIEPEENSLNMIFRDMARITKYFSKLSTCQCFYILICSYRE